MFKRKRWTSRLFPCPGYYKQCCDEHWGTCVSFNSGFLGVYAQQWDCWVIRQFYLQFFKESPLFSKVAVLVCIPTNSVGGFPFLHTLSSIQIKHSCYTKMLPQIFSQIFSRNSLCLNPISCNFTIFIDEL